MDEGEQNRKSNPSTGDNTNSSIARNSTQNLRNNRQRQIARRMAKRSHLGKIDSMEKAGKIIGNIIDALIPQEGKKASIEFNFNIPIHPSDNVFLSFRMTGEAERVKSNKVKLRTEIQLGVMGKLEMDLVFSKLETHLRVAGLGYIETVGSNSAESVRFIGLFVRQTIATSSEDIAEYVMKRTSRDKICEGMVKEEYAEEGFGIEASAGIGSTNRWDIGDNQVEVGTELRRSQGTRYTVNQDSKNHHRENMGLTEVVFNANFEPGFDLTGKVKVDNEGSKTNIEAGMEGEGKISVDKLNTMLLSSAWVSRLITLFRNIIQKGAGVLQGNTEQKVGIFIGMMGNISADSILTSHYASGALKRLERFEGINIGHKLRIKAKLSNGKLSGEIELERFESMEFGKGNHDIAHLLLQNIPPVIKLSF